MSCDEGGALLKYLNNIGLNSMWDSFLDDPEDRATVFRALKKFRDIDASSMAPPSMSDLKQEAENLHTSLYFELSHAPTLSKEDYKDALDLQQKLVHIAHKRKAEFTQLMKHATYLSLVFPIVVRVSRTSRAEVAKVV